MSHGDDLALMRPQLLRYAMLRLRNRHQAEDAVQDALLAAVEGIESFSGNSSLRTWVGGILKHKIADALRASWREEALEMDLEIPGAPGDLAAELLGQPAPRQGAAARARAQ